MADLAAFTNDVPNISEPVSSTSSTLATWDFNTTNGSTGWNGEIWIGAYWASFIEHPDAQQATVNGEWLRLAVLPLILVAGFVGNLLTMALMSRPNMRKHSYSPYLLALAACDSSALVIRALFWVNLVALKLGEPVLVLFRSRLACAAVEYLCTANHVLCSWLVVCLTFERLLVVVFPLKSSRIVTVGTSVRVVAAMFAGSLILLSYVPVVVKWVSDSGGCVIQFPQDLQAHFVLATTFVSLLPLLLICCGNLVIVIALYQQAQQRKNLIGDNSTTAPGKTRAAKERHSNDKKVLVLQDDSSREDSARDVSDVFVTEGLGDGNGHTRLADDAKGQRNVSEVRDVETCSGDKNSQGSRSHGPQKKTAGNAATTTTTTTAATKHNLAKKTAPSNSGKGGDQQMRRVTVTLLTVCLAFLILVMPNALLVLTLGLRPDWTGLLPLMDPLALLWDANFAINFYLYVITGGTFRAELLAMLGIRRG